MLARPREYRSAYNTRLGKHFPCSPDFRMGQRGRGSQLMAGGHAVERYWPWAGEAIIAEGE